MVLALPLIGCEEPPVAPKPVIERLPWMIFFGADSTEITAESDRTIVAAVKAFKAFENVRVRQVYVTGHTDLTGSPAHNHTLSMRRAEVVVARLVELGIPAEAISARGHSSAEPLVTSGEIVPEKQNRRVEVIGYIVRE